MMLALLDVIGSLAILASLATQFSLNRRTRDRSTARLKRLLAKLFCRS